MAGVLNAIGLTDVAKERRLGWKRERRGLRTVGVHLSAL